MRWWLQRLEVLQLLQLLLPSLLRMIILVNPKSLSRRLTLSLNMRKRALSMLQTTMRHLVLVLLLLLQFLLLVLLNMVHLPLQLLPMCIAYRWTSVLPWKMNWSFMSVSLFASSMNTMTGGLSVSEWIIHSKEWSLVHVSLLAL